MRFSTACSELGKVGGNPVSPTFKRRGCEVGEGLAIRRGAVITVRIPVTHRADSPLPLLDCGVSGHVPSGANSGGDFRISIGLTGGGGKSTHGI